MPTEKPKNAGPFGAWLRKAELQLGVDGPMDVPCGTCVGCCTSSYFIHISPDETETLARIPKALLSPAPGLGKGHRLLGHFDNGHCPMFVDGACSIYEHRPRACRSYDCRVFSAAGITAGGPEVGRINERVKAWRFRYAGADERAQAKLVQAAAKALRKRVGSTVAPSRLALMALKLRKCFASDGAVKDRARLDNALKTEKGNGRH
jgi:Fe-S-cluster containining protein